MKILGTKIELNKVSRKPLDNSEETWVKYGIEQKVHDYIQEGRAGTEAPEIIKKAGSIQALPHVQELFKDSAEKEALNMNIDPFIANRMMKMGAIAEKKILAEKQRQEALEKDLTDAETTQPKGDNE